MLTRLWSPFTTQHRRPARPLVQRHLRLHSPPSHQPIRRRALLEPLLLRLRVSEKTFSATPSHLRTGTNPSLHPLPPLSSHDVPLIVRPLCSTCPSSLSPSDPSLLPHLHLTPLVRSHRSPSTPVSPLTVQRGTSRSSRASTSASGSRRHTARRSYRRGRSRRDSRIDVLGIRWIMSLEYRRCWKKQGRVQGGKGPKS